MAPKEVQSTRNLYDNPSTPAAIGLNTATFEILASAFPLRSGYKISLMDPHDILVLEKDPGGDHTDRGFWVMKRTLYESKDGEVPDGPIYAKALSGTPEVFFQEQ